ncbi:hypothetical protein ACMD2_08163 [Ananas comosus]|uniref:Uncharacterized protein n=1 Tax=Ananas comosus TaxID=4615 RepID=A0A199VPK2_ANACO|nr:hypothetical protein ACMD2_08163 [Ananas comosus]
MDFGGKFRSSKSEYGMFLAVYPSYDHHDDIHLDYCIVNDNFNARHNLGASSPDTPPTPPKLLLGRDLSAEKSTPKELDSQALKKDTPKDDKH